MSIFWTDTLIDVFLTIYVLDCIFMGLVIMMQRSKQEGLGAAFGGGFTESIWGAQTSNVLVKGTAWAAAIFFILSISLARLYTHREAMSLQINGQPSTILQQLTAPAVVPAATNSPATNAPVSTTPVSAATATQPVPVPPAAATNSTAKPASK
jgi:preprotein translocase subunit SecG